MPDGHVSFGLDRGRVLLKAVHMAPFSEMP